MRVTRVTISEVHRRRVLCMYAGKSHAHIDNKKIVHHVSDRRDGGCILPDNRVMRIP